MNRRRVLEIGSLVWAAAGAAVALSALSDVNDDAMALVTLASIVFPLCALGGAIALRLNNDRTAGLLLLLSVATPTYFALPLNVPALVIGIALLAAPSLIAGNPPTPKA